jgi:hypothetical protein
MSESNDKVVKAKPVVSIRIDVFDDGTIKTREQCAPTHEQSFAMLLTGMQQGTVQEFLLKQMTTKAKSQTDKDQINMIILYYNEMVKQIISKVHEEYKRNQPVISPTEVFMRRVQSKSRKSR